MLSGTGPVASGMSVPLVWPISKVVTPKGSERSPGIYKPPVGTERRWKDRATDPDASDFLNLPVRLVEGRP
jgi:hypothetical protein